MKRRLPIGISDFREIVEEGYVYVDKTLLIEELMENGAKIVLIPRMRRFGKTLNLSMLSYFFEKSSLDTSFLFQSLKIWHNEKMRALQGQFPVIFLTLKDIKFQTWQDTHKAFSAVIADEFRRHRYLLEGDTLAVEEKSLFLKILEQEDNLTLLSNSLKYLTEWLYRYHGKRVVLLIDEYDTPAHAAYVGGFYDILIPFLRNWLSSGLKDNKFLEKGVLTGILRIAKETIFSGLNNVKTYTILNEDFQDKFGFLHSEVQMLLQEYGLEKNSEELKQWYNGYIIGSCAGVYNPWSVLNCLADEGVLSPYWVNTSENGLMKKLITCAPWDLKSDLEVLLKGGCIEKTVEDGIVFSQLENNSEAIWSLLLFSGYLTLDAKPQYGMSTKLRIPNREVEELYKSLIAEWFKTTLAETNYRLLLKSLVTGDIDTFSQIFQKFFSSSISMFDTGGDAPEKGYHAFVLGMLLGLKDTYEIKSNRESGYGRYDVMLIPKNSDDLGVVMEFKKADNVSLDDALVSALKQIEEKKYAQELEERGISRILKLALAFQGKKVAFAHL